MTLASLRHLPGIEVAMVGGLVWLRGRAVDDSVVAALAALPASGRFEWLASEKLRRLDHRIPGERLPAATWQPLCEWSRVSLPTAAMPAALSVAHPLRLVRSSVEQEPNLVLTTMEEFGRFAVDAPRIRLERLRFAAAADGRVIVHGLPLPPLSGRRFVLNEGVAVPAGFCWEPAVSLEVVVRCFAVFGAAVVLWNEDNSLTRVHEEQWMPVTRSGVRAAFETLGN